MESSSIRQLLTHLGAESKQGSRWVSAKCPLAPWKHENGQDKSPSFGVKINPTGPSFFNCYSCHAKGSLYDLVMLVAQHNKMAHRVEVDIKSALAMAEKENNLDGDEIPDYEQFVQTEKASRDLIEFPDYWLESFDSVLDHPVAMHYMENRRQPVDLDAIKKYDLRYDTARKRICFPIRTFDGMLVGLHGRDITGINELRYYSYPWKKQRNPDVWYGEQFVDLSKPVALTEGNFDVLQISTEFPNVLGNLSTQFNDEKVSRIRKAPSLITWFDYGKGGNLARRLVEHRLPHHPVQHILPTEDEGDAADTPRAEIRRMFEDFLDLW